MFPQELKPCKKLSIKIKSYVIAQTLRNAYTQNSWGKINKHITHSVCINFTDKISSIPGKVSLKNYRR